MNTAQATAARAALEAASEALTRTLTSGVVEEARYEAALGLLDAYLLRYCYRPLPPLPCRACGAPVPASVTHQRLQLCALDAAYGCRAYCEVCGESWPEHGPSGRGCSTWVCLEDTETSYREKRTP